jgi:hypothetical protein
MGFMRQRKFLVYGLAALGVLLSACGAGSPGSATTTPPLSSTTTLPATASTSSSEAQTVSACLASALSASATQGSGEGGHDAVVVVFSNISPRACSLHGYPTTAWFDGSGGVHLHATVTQEVPSGPIATVTLSPGQKAATTVWTDNPDVPSQPSCSPVTAIAVAVETPADTRVLMAPIGITVCSTNNNIGTTPITPGTAQSPI